MGIQAVFCLTSRSARAPQLPTIGLIPLDGARLAMYLLSILITLFLGTSFAPVAMAAYSAAPRLSAEQLIVHYGVASDDGEAREPGALFHQQYARGYLAGVADAAQGRQWCDTGRMKTLEIDARIITELKQLPARARQGDAAALIVAILARRFPCSSSSPSKTGG